MPVRNKAFGERLRKRRGGRSLREVADGAKVTPPAIHGYERGRIPRGEILERLAGFYGVTTKWLLTGDDTAGQIAELPAPYEKLSKSQKKIARQFEELLESDDEGILRHLQGQLALLVELMERRRAERRR